MLPTRIITLIAFVAITLLTCHIFYKIYRLQQVHESKIARFVGSEAFDPNDSMFKPLIENISKTRAPILTDLPPKEVGDYKEEFLVNSTEQKQTNDNWILYQNFSPSKVNYQYANFALSEKPKPPVDSKNTTEKDISNKQLEDKNKKEERFVFEKFLSDIVNNCKINNVKNYDEFSKIAHKQLFLTEEGENVKVGKIFVATKNNFVIFPYHSRGFSGVNVVERPWWKAAYGDNDERVNRSDYTGEPVGLTKIYPDIIAEKGITDLTRTIFFKFNAYGEDFLLGVDLRFSDLSFNFFDEVKYELIPLALLGLFLPLLIYKSKNEREIAIDNTVDRIYKIQRIDRQKVGYNAGQKNEYTFSTVQSIKNTEENISRIERSTQLYLDTKVIGAKLGGLHQDTKQTIDTDLIEMKIEKKYDLNLKTGNLKTVELWNVCRPDNDKYSLGIIEVLWQNNRNENEITLTQLFWDSNTSASYLDISKALKKHLHTNESDSFIFDQSSELDREPDIITILKDKVDYIKAISDRFDSFNNRRLLFDNNVPILKELYATNCEIFATCSMEFLDNLRRQGKLREILGFKVTVRYIIDGDTRKFRNFYEDLDEELQSFIRSLPNLRIIEFRPSQETIYLNRDFCIVSFGNDKCVIYTDMSDTQAQKGWLSWREVDIDYYEAIKSFIESGDVEKKVVNTYIETL